MTIYEKKPERFLTQLHASAEDGPASELYCAGFELQQWRCKPFAFHLAEWLPEYALPEEELRLHHGNILLKLNQAAVRVYTSEKYKARGEAGEIALHAICRDFFDTIPISPRVFYKSASNDVVKAFDLVHVRFPDDSEMEIWLGESKLYSAADAAISDAISSVKSHLDQGFLENQKLLLGPQIPKSTPRYDDIMGLFKKGASLDALIKHAVFVVGIVCNSDAAAAATAQDDHYLAEAKAELAYLAKRLINSGLSKTIRVVIVYIPVPDKATLVKAFDERLKGLQ